MRRAETGAVGPRANRPAAVLTLLLAIGSTQPRPTTPGADAIEGRYWRAIELAGKPVPSQDAGREAHLLFQPVGRLSGSDGCNRITGSYDLKGEAIAFGEIAVTRMACAGIGDIDRVFRDALKSASRLTVSGDRMSLFDAAGKRVALFAARVGGSPLAGSGVMDRVELTD